ncbi:hypothetical protein MMP65_05815 [Acinetobacter sp. ANC 3926]|uniref:hypothetical protein n=1 Tax=Acinetobacter genomosp. 15BJ TaxID=106651 RepID=UPI001F4ABC91|nr:hypothetical protein [Acinetobacter genomosp. 15BJ]MCH7290976.1 hypothetical protein [Acinetobacter genomosp. 15BJ]
MNIEKIIDTNEERQKFIKWAARNHYDVSEIPTVHGVLFKRQSTTDAWMGWLYNAKDKAEKLEGCVVVPVEPTQDELIAIASVCLEPRNKGENFDFLSINEAKAVRSAMVEAAKTNQEES